MYIFYVTRKTQIIIPDCLVGKTEGWKIEFHIHSPRSQLISLEHVLINNTTFS